MWRAEWRTELRALVSGSVGPGVLAQGSFEGRHVLEGPARSPALNEGQDPKTQVAAGRQGEASAEVGVPNPWRCGARPLGRGPSGVSLGLRLPPEGRRTRSLAVQHTEGWAEVRALVSMSMSPSV